jgi:hypothetical protein
MRNKAILSLTDVDDIEIAKVLAEKLGPYFGGVLIPTWGIYLNLLRIIQQSGATIWLNTGAGLPSQLRHEIRSCMHYFFPDTLSPQPEKDAIPIEAFITLGYPHLVEEAVWAFTDGLELYKKTHLRHPIPRDWKPKIFSIAALTTEEKDDRILKRVEIAKKHGLFGVIVPCEFVAQVKAMGLRTIVTAVRDSVYAVVDDDQVITCTPDQARQADPDYVIVGRPITQRCLYGGLAKTNLEEAERATKYFLTALGIE